MHDCIHNNRAYTRHIRGRSCLCLKTSPRPKNGFDLHENKSVGETHFCTRVDTKAKGNTELVNLQYNDLYNLQ